jgi:hypothetical protein
MPLSDYQISYRGITMGDGTVYDLMKVDGPWDMYVEDGDRANPRGQGMIPGFRSARNWKIAVDLEVRGTPGSTTLADAVEALMKALSPDLYNTASETQDVFTYKWPGEDEKFMFVHPIKRGIPRTNRTEFGLVPVSFDLLVYDPRRYGDAFDSGVKTTGFSITNGGTSYAYPRITVTTDTLGGGQITNTTTGDIFALDGLSAGVTIEAYMRRYVQGRGDLLVIFQGTTNRYANWQIPRTPFRLAPGSNTITITASSGYDVRLRGNDTYM